jgi:glycosyltransferase involved in cell wall biosynthesis
MRLAFHAPMKPPGDPVPSGDRAIARGLMSALSRAGAAVELASTLRSRDGTGDAARQAEIMQAARAEVARLTGQGARAGWKAWITYHSYYKAPDLIGPAVSTALGIPYLQIEASRARKRLAGPWAAFAEAAEAASDAAAVIFHFTEHDAETLRRHAPAGQRLIPFAPFLDRESLPDPGPREGPILAAGMMRPGDKLSSYRLIAETLAAVPRSDWVLEIAGDGPARTEVEALMAPLRGTVRFLGALDEHGLAAAHRRAALMFWPGVNEAFGMTYLEAQAAGLPVLAQDRPGVREVLAPGVYPAPESGSAALAARLELLLADGALRRREGDAARHMVGARHLLPQAAATLAEGLAAAGVGP